MIENQSVTTMTMTQRRTPTLLAAGLITVISLAAEVHAQSMNDARELFKELTQTKTIISSEENEWAQEKASIEDLLSITREESALLQEKIEALNKNVTTTDEDREKLLNKIKEAREAAGSFDGVVAELEASARELIPFLPTMLKSELQPLIMRLPKESAKTTQSVSQRMQTVIALLSQMGKFNGALTMNSEVKELDAGVSVEVKTLYLGLAMAIFTDASKEYSGYGKPGADGWTWTTVDGPAADKISTAIAIYESTVDPAFVKLPVDID
jgi:chromosome segregation ATPase